MPIIAKEEIVIPEKRFDKLWVFKLEVYAPSEKESSATITYIPRNDAGEFYPEGAFNKSINDVYAYATANPDSNIAKAMYYIVEAAKETYEKE